MDKRIIWVDLETTGLYPDWDDILEIAVVVTDEKLKVVGFSQHVIAHSSDTTKGMEEVVFNMHTKSGLLSELSTGVPKHMVVEQILSMFQKMKIPSGYYPLAGNSIHFDRAFLDVHMPEIAAIPSKKNIDVSSVHQLALQWAPEVALLAPTKKRHHRAMEDILESIEELRYYQETLFK